MREWGQWPPYFIWILFGIQWKKLCSHPVCAARAPLLFTVDLGAVFLFVRFCSEISVLGFAQVSLILVSVLLSAAEHRQGVFLFWPIHSEFLGPVLAHRFSCARPEIWSPAQISFCLILLRSLFDFVSSPVRFLGVGQIRCPSFSCLRA
jgi:hypothetical protein